MATPLMLILFLNLCGSGSAIEAPSTLGKGISPENWRVVLESHKGHYTLFTFWGALCEPCLAEIPELIKVYQQLKPKGLVICEVNTDISASYEQAAKTLEQLQVPFERYYKLPGNDGLFSRAIGPKYTANPYAVLFAPDGTEVATFSETHNAEEWLKILSPYFQSQEATPTTVPAAPNPEADTTNPNTLSVDPFSLIGLPVPGMPEEPNASLPAGAVKSGRTPFWIEAPASKPVSATEIQLVIPFVCKQDAHLTVSTFVTTKIRGKGIQLGKVDVTKKDFLTVFNTTEEILRLPGAVLVPIPVPANTPGGEIPVEVVFTYQGCTDGPRGACYLADSFDIAGTLTNGANGWEMKGLTARWLDPAQPKPIPEEPGEVNSGASQPELTNTGGTDSVENLFSSESLHDSTIVERAFKRSLFLVFVLAFIGGILTSFTPCVYPMIPATVAIFGAKEVKSRLSACSLAATYIMGVALSYASLGILAATVGTVFGTMMENPWLISIVAVFYVILALSMLDAFVFYLPSSWVSAASRVNRKGYAGAFLMGLVSSIVFAPCGEPILLGILAWVAKTQSFFLGFWLLFVYAWGIGVLFFVIATFSGSIQYLPRAGAWMVAVKDFFGLLLFGLALYWMQYVLPPAWLWGLATLYFLGVATFIHTKNHGFAGWPRAVLSFATLTALLAGSLPLQRFATIHGWLPPPAGSLASSSGEMSTPSSSITWLKGTPLEDLVRAKGMGKPAIVDYRTNVCPKCDEIEREVFANPEVQKALMGFVTIQVNLSEVDTNTQIREIQSRQAIMAAPVIEFYDSQGNLLRHKRIADVLTAEEFLKHIQDIG